MNSLSKLKMTATKFSQFYFYKCFPRKKSEGGEWVIEPVKNMNHYKINGPAVVSFSGGRSSGFMLWNILDAYDGKIPYDIKVVFCNTGLEHSETNEMRIFNKPLILATRFPVFVQINAFPVQTCF